jgi:hypothetical protein
MISTHDSGLNSADLEKLEKAFFANLQHEYGRIGLDQKRPFGNSDLHADILTIIGAIPAGDDGHGPCWHSQQIAYAAALYKGLVEWLQKKYL